MSIIVAEHLSKVYPVAIKEPGLKGTLNHFFKRTYRNIEAVKDVSFQIQPGEMVGFLGPNGAGKTTTLKMLTGLIHPSSGRVEVAGHVPFQRQEAFLQKITLVMGQKQQLIWDLPALDSLRINGAVYGIPEKECRKRIGQLTEMLSLEGKLNQPVRKLSLGERMKAELMAALLHNPDVLFLDEPTLGLDVNGQASVRDFLRDYNQRTGATILLTSHYMADITALCDRVILIYAGQLIYDGSLDGLVERFAPYREVQLELTHAVTDPEKLRQQISKYGEVEEIAGQSVRLLVRRDTLTATVGQILIDFEILDLTVTEPPLEEVIGRVFTAGAIV
ncbi:ABC transporter ATP-binding protein [Laspinema olomoucense]|uniref:ATP-binding cassette domain-containing protein n=1 Tax=Laspinema olomoucense D3b TaxID=2953688 RepID=A0ABT2N8W1_9CYAN|nr:MULTISPECIES: ATP-binding cassette domain-containing protein [unclassified Laspinema]MCT7971645.1 ATP-binding cassette domain-containing protein [Laspinema sp. D3d]MCT7979138.1 ATP-binding cassette domain-containing protein [Laspinema sp. D3b]MCT7992896.1 ATP-binding cassette domain-containing protein [Laspinema sp. D3c]